ncbi:MAG: type sorting protein [Ignavibacteria bacterium]|nr:type sorting protein [Ignavibacteria bacterium]
MRHEKILPKFMRAKIFVFCLFLSELFIIQFAICQPPTTTCTFYNSTGQNRIINKFEFNNNSINYENELMSSDYIDAVANSAVVAPGGVYNYDLIGGWASGNEYQYYYYIFVDFGGDGVYTTTGDTIYRTQFRVLGEQSGNLTIPSNLQPGRYRMRVTNGWDLNIGVTTGCGDGGSYSQAVDFTLVVKKGITIDSIVNPNLTNNLTYCAGSDIKIFFSANKDFNSSNGFTVQLSDANGNFNSPTTIGTNDEYKADQYELTSEIPESITSVGSAYRIRIISSNPNEQSDDNGADITINPRPNPNITGSSSVCERNQSTFSTPLIGGFTNLWLVSGGSINGSSTNNTVDITWGNASTGIVKLVQTINATGCNDTATKSITINPLPVPLISGPNITQKEKIETYSDIIGGFSSYKWEVTGGTIQGADNNQSVNVQWAESGIGKVKLIVTNSFNCKDSTAIDVTITKANIQITGKNSVCENEATNYNTNFSSQKTNLWFATGGTIQGTNTDTTVKIQWGKAGNGKLELIQTNTQNQSKDTVSINITINQLPTPGISGNKTALVNSTLQYSASALASGTNLWKCSGGTIQGTTSAQQIFIIWQTEGAGKITLVQTNAEACSATATMDVTVGKPQPLSILGNLTVCETKIETYHTTTPIGAESNWFATNGAIQGQSKGDSIIVIWQTKGSGKIKLIQTDNSKGWKDSLEKSVVINPIPSVNLATIPNMCLNDSKIILTAGTPVSGTYTGIGVTGNQFDPQVAGVGSHTITYSLTNPEGCTDSKWTTIKVNPLPPVPVISEKDSTLFSDASSGNQWFYQDTLIVGATGTSYKPTKDGLYNLEVTDANGCKNRTTEPYYFPSGGQDPIITSIPNLILKDLICESIGSDTLKITNQGGNTLSISKIEITGSDAGMFSFEPPINQIQILPKVTKNIPFVFKATSLGNKQAQIEITSNAKNKSLFIVTLNAKKDSVGFSLSSNTIKFRNIPENSPVTLFDTIHNTGTLPITFQIPGDISPDFSIFSISPLTTQPNSTSVVKALFNGGSLGYSKIFKYRLSESQCNRQIEITFDAFVGVEAGATLQVGEVEAETGEVIDIPFYLRNAIDLQKAGVSGFTADLRYNASLLQSESSILQSELSTDGSERIVHLSFGISPKIDSTLEKYSFRAMLGNDSVTILKLENIKPKNGSAVFNAINGTFRLKNICREGGPRLITDKGKVALMQVRPNPAGESVEIEFETVEPGRTQLKLINTLGRIERILWDGEIGKGVHKIALDLMYIPNGTYFLILQTSYKTRNVRMDVIK